MYRHTRMQALTATFAGYCDLHAAAPAHCGARDEAAGVLAEGFAAAA